MEITVAIGTFGDLAWQHLAFERAIPSAQAPVVHHHGDTLADARNRALEKVETEWVVFLDADDELEPGYHRALERGSADLRGPAVRYVRHGHPTRARLPKVAGHRHACSADCLRQGNFLVIGTAVRAEAVRAEGGFREYDVYEDWDLWQRLWLAGATVETLPAAVYRAHWRPDSRNRGPAIAEKNRVHREIIARNFPRPEDREPLGANL